MQRTVTEGRGPVRFGPPAPEPGLPVLPELTAVLGAAASRSAPEPPGGGEPVREAACRHWARRGLLTEAENVAAGPGAPALLLALLGAYGGDVMLPRPCPAWWTPQVRLLGRRAYHVPTPAECGGVPDPYALLETVRRVRAEGGDPRVLLLSVADDPTATVPPPELLLEACEAAATAGLFVVSDESWRDTVHRPHDTLVLSPAEMLPDQTAVLVDLSGALLPAGWPAAVVRFPGTPHGTWLRARTLDVLTATGALVAGPVAGAAAHALDEPDAVAGRVRAAATLHGVVAAAAHRELLAVGALARPPQAGRHVYADLTPLREGLARQGVGDAMELEDWLGRRLGAPTPGGQRFADELGALRVRLSTGPMLGATPEERLAALTARDPLGLPHVRRSLELLGSVLAGLAG
ncbi:MULTISPECIES: aminotransferase class I/II-fold pyridoxal phosphate-dependent enzyme [unclassified Streptomyces]|uniref:aminotransferase class I/II-fold pyridoxal phosphate-dependent enzyme n=1 Tax=unclassified Streptomyces TaxID=2593676 RepID=UPI001BEA1B3E|nr:MULTISPECIES: aminotransferase class I/II-fold pyridoxal phosphate-dependent enzyme [unclassified Streptomyces]MBT2405363.1 pyridoxal phosphate-dependent aminotransferase [Streptomyces sp. ISL-21]MBT2454330.1 pyridoxal phosphate-dependent aminotransferase [Streptomyces sp. ISL-86]MBT2611478.1 pyridoxal phosphate-dependent aminotransferase [Streptomyces sp. ISL-87]